MKQRFFAAILSTVLFSLHASALSIGDKAPDFSLTATSGPTVSLSGDQGQVRVIFFFGWAYPDGGCNIEVYSCREYLEMEMLGPLQTLHPGQQTSHTECWRIVAETFPKDRYPAIVRLDPHVPQRP